MRAETLVEEVGAVLRECGKGRPMTSREIYVKCELPEQIDQIIDLARGVLGKAIPTGTQS